jgi:toxin CptA
MHNAPSVSYPVGRPRFAGLLAACLWLIGAAVTLLWLHEAEVPGWRQAVAAAVLIGVGLWILLSWMRSPSGQLRWDGTEWTGPSGSGAAVVQVALDLQHVLLVRWRAPQLAHWLWLERSRCPHRWLELRRAVYSRARAPALPPARPPAATP